MFDLDQLNTSDLANRGVVMEVRHPITGEVAVDSNKKPVTLTLCGEDSDVYRRSQREAADRRIQARQSGRRMAMTAEELENESLQTLIDCTRGWSGLGVAGVELEFSAENALLLYRKFPWLREQAEAFIQDRSRFLKASPKS